ncbi:uncharacterized protein ISCGN_001674 [Ixodes scapularis]
MLGQAKITDWPTFQKEEVAAELADIEKWMQKVTAAVTKHTKTIQLTTDNPEVDPHLLHMWEVRQGLLRRWKRQKRNRKLKAKIAQITRQTEDYAKRLGRQNWNKVCDQPQGTLSNKRTWAIIRALLNRAEPKATSRQQIQKLIHNFSGRNGKIFEKLKEEVIDNLSSRSKSIILALDIKGAFDNVSHEAVLRSLQETACGKKAYNYVRDFLADRTAMLGLGSLRTKKLKVPQRGTHQGSVISPLLFNLGMRGLPERLKGIEGINHAIYADALTVWTTTGAAGTKQNALQEAVCRIEAYLRDCALACALEKSELLIMKKRTRGRPPQEDPDPELTLNGVTITKVNTIRILGLNFQGDGAGTTTVKGLQETVSQVTHLVRRVANRKHELKEQDSIRLVQALVISRITYETPYLGLRKSEKEEINVLIRKTYKLALGLPPTNSTERVMQLGVYNLGEEMKLASVVSRLARNRREVDACAHHRQGDDREDGGEDERPGESSGLCTVDVHSGPPGVTGEPVPRDPRRELGGALAGRHHSSATL